MPDSCTEEKWIVGGCDRMATQAPPPCRPSRETLIEPNGAQRFRILGPAFQNVIGDFA